MYVLMHYIIKLYTYVCVCVQSIIGLVYLKQILANKENQFNLSTE